MDSKFDKGWSNKLRESSSELVEPCKKPPLPIFQQLRSSRPESKDFGVQITEVVPLLCCRRFFVRNEQLNHSETLICEFKDYAFPWENHNMETLKRTICSFLNSFGGVIYIGVQETGDMRSFVKGRVYTEIDRQRVVMDINAIQAQLQPQREVINRVNTRFVPVRYSCSLKFIPGCFVVKIKVCSGNPLHTYFFEDNERVVQCYYRDEKSVRRIDE
mgnify:FL=1|jgi:hypothetical protein